MTQLIQAMRADLYANDPIVSAYPSTTPPSELPEEVRLHVSQAYANFSATNRQLAVKELINEVKNALGKVATPAVSISTPTIALGTNGSSAHNGFQRPTPKVAEGPVKVTITYCAACGYEPQTLELTSALMHELRDNISSIELIPWHDGMFDVVVNGDLIHSMSRDGGFPESATVINAVREYFKVVTN
jgi:selenoprotein W-related protein